MGHSPGSVTVGFGMRLKDAGIELLVETDPEGVGIGHIVLADPDGNQIMFDQHVPASKP